MDGVEMAHFGWKLVPLSFLAFSVFFLNENVQNIQYLNTHFTYFKIILLIFINFCRHSLAFHISQISFFLSQTPINEY